MATYKFPVFQIACAVCGFVTSACHEDTAKAMLVDHATYVHLHPKPAEAV